MLVLQAVASVILAVYSYEIRSFPYLSLQVFCFALICLKLWKLRAARYNEYPYDLRSDE
jgi:hypothetical protein